MQMRMRRRAIELGLAGAALVALALVELAGLSRGMLVGLVAAELLAWAGVAVMIVRSRRVGRHRKRAPA